MILTSNRGFAEWGDVFGDPVVATALLDRLLHHAVVIQIEGSSYRLRQHADLVPEHLRCRAPITPPAAPAATPPRPTAEKQEPRSTRRLITDTLPTRDFSSGTSRENSIGVDTTGHPDFTSARQVAAYAGLAVGRPAQASGCRSGCCRSSTTSMMFSSNTFLLLKPRLRMRSSIPLLSHRTWPTIWRVPRERQ